MKSLYLIVIITIFFVFNGIAQQNFKPGFVITNENDTVYGEIDYRGDVFMALKCNFRAESQKAITYKPNEIKAYRFVDSKFFVSKMVPTGRFFLEFLIEGKINVYYHRDDVGDHYWIEKGNDTIVELSYEEYIKTIDGKKLLFKSKQHAGILMYATNEAPELRTKIEKLEKPNHRSLVKIAKMYHESVCDDEQCIIYEKNVPFIKVAAEPFGAVRKFNENLNNYNEFGINVYTWIPRANEKLYFKTGISTIGYKDNNNEQHRINIIPIQLRYLAPFKIIKPYAGLGIEYFFERNNNIFYNMHILSMNVGLNVNFYENWSITAGINSGYTPLLFMVGNNKTKFEELTRSYTLGVYYQF